MQQLNNVAGGGILKIEVSCADGIRDNLRFFSEGNTKIIQGILEHHFFTVRHTDSNKDEIIVQNAYTNSSIEMEGDNHERAAYRATMEFVRQNLNIRFPDNKNLLGTVVKDNGRFGNPTKIQNMVIRELSQFSDAELPQQPDESRCNIM